MDATVWHLIRNERLSLAQMRRAVHKVRSEFLGYFVSRIRS